ncbi:beta strand repeat-containing protein, partial [Gallibacterium genomosp. 3]
MSDKDWEELSKALEKNGGSLAELWSYASNIKDEQLEDPKIKEKIFAFGKAIWKAITAVTGYHHWANYGVRAEAGDDSKVAKDKKFGLSGSFSIVDMANTGRVLVGQNVNLLSTGKIGVEANNQGEGISFVGNAGLKPLAESAGAAIGGNVSYLNILNNAVALIGKGAVLNAQFIDINANNKMMQTNIAFAAGKAGKNGVEGMIVIGTGGNNALALIDDEAQIKAYVNEVPKISLDTQDEKENSDSSNTISAPDTSSIAEESKGKVSVTATNNTLANNVAAGMMAAHGAAVGAGIAVGVYDNNTIAGTMDIADKIEDLSSDELAKLSSEQKQVYFGEKRARTFGLGVFTENEKAFLGAKTANNANKGLIQGHSVAINSNASGLINAIGLAVAIATKKDADGKPVEQGELVNNESGGESGGNTSHPTELLPDLQVSDDGAEFIASLASLFGEENAITSALTEVDDTMSNGSGGSSADDIAQSGNSDTLHGSDTAEGSSPNNNAQNSGGTNNGSVSDSSKASTKSQTQISVAGSVGVNIISGKTASFLNGVNVVLEKDNKNGSKETALDVTSNDTVFIGAWTGAGAVSSNKDSGSAVGVSGSVAVNSLNRDVLSAVSESRINGIQNMSVESLKDGVVAAFGLSAAVAKAQQGTSVAVAPAISVNLQDSKTAALLINSELNTDKGMDSAKHLDIIARNFDVNVTGGLNTAIATSGSGSSVAAGGSIVVTNIHNTLSSGIYGGTYKVENLNIRSIMGVTQVSAAAGFSLSKGEGTSVGFQGAIAYNGLHNNSVAFIRGGANIQAGFVTLRSYDESYDADDKMDSGKLKKEKAKKDAYLSKLEEEKNIDATGDSYRGIDKEHPEQNAAVVERGKSAEEKQALAEKQYAAEARTKANGNIIVTAAGSFALTLSGGSGGAIGAAISVSQIENKMYTDIADSNITANQIETEATSHALLVGAAGGVAGGNGRFNVAGSLSWNDVANEAISSVTNSTLTTDTLIFHSNNHSRAVNVAGQVGVSTKGAAIGLAIAYHGMKNKTQVLFEGSTLSGRNPILGVDLTAQAQNDSKVVTVGAGVTAAKGLALNGTFAVSEGSNDTEVIFDEYEENTTTKTKHRSKIDYLKSSDVTATDASQSVVVTGSITGSLGGVAVSGGVAINSLGGFAASTNHHDAQKTVAAIRNTDITTAGSNEDISVKAEDKSLLVTVAAGFAGSGSSVALQGVAAATLINKGVWSGFKNSNIKVHDDISKLVKDYNAEGEKNATEEKPFTPLIVYQPRVQVDAINYANIAGVATGIAASASVAGGVAVNVNRINIDTDAQVNGGTYTVGDMQISAQSKPDILSASAGVGASGSVAVAGSFGTNLIKNNTRATVDGSATIISEGNVGVIATSDDLIANYAGSISGAGTAAIGASVTVNKISGATKSLVQNSSITAKGLGNSLSYRSGINDSGFIRSSISKENFIASSLADNPIYSTSTGLIVNSSATHSIASSLFTAGGAGSVAVSGTVNVNLIEGETLAAINNSNLNAGLGTEEDDLSNANIIIQAQDYTNAVGFTGAVAGSGIAAVGITSDTNRVSRTTHASLTYNNDDPDDENYGKRVTTQSKAYNVKVLADARQALATFDAAAAIAGSGASVGTNVIFNILASQTKAGIINANLSYNNLYLKALHQDDIFVSNITTAGAAIGAGVGLNVSIVDQASKVNANVEGSNLVGESITDIEAKHEGNIETFVSSASVNGIGASLAGSGSSNNMRQVVKALVKDSNISSGWLTGSANNSSNISAYGGVLALGGASTSVGASVSVNNFSDTVLMEVDNSTLSTTIGSLKLNAVNNRDATLAVSNGSIGAMALGANVMVVNIKNHKSETDQKDENTEGIYSILAKIKEKLANSEQKDAFEGADQEEEVLGTLTRIKGASTLTTAGTLELKATEEKNKVRMVGGGGSAGMFAANAAVGVLNKQNDIGVKVEDSTLKSYSVVLKAEDKGKNDLSLYQGTAGTVALNAVYGSIKKEGNINVEVNRSNIEARNGADISALDSTSNTLNAYGISAAVVAAGAVTALVNDNTTVKVILNSKKSDSGASSGEEANTSYKIDAGIGALNVISDRQNTMKATAMGGSLGIDSGVAVTALLTEKGETSIEAKGSKYTFKGNSVAFKASRLPSIDLNAGSGSAGIKAVQVTHANALVLGKTSILVADDNTFTAKNVSFVTLTGKEKKEDSNESETETQKANVSVALTAGSIALEGGIGVNNVSATTNTETVVDIGAVKYAPQSLGQTAPAVEIKGLNNLSRDVTSKALTVAGAFAVGNSEGQTIAKDSIKVSAKGGNVYSLDMQAYGFSYTHNLVNGDGGAAVDISPNAASVDNNQQTNTEVSLSGTWNVTNEAKISAMQYDQTATRAKATRVGLLAAAKSTSSNTLGGDSKVILDEGTKINASSLDIKAYNDISTGLKYANQLEGLSISLVGAQVSSSTETVTKGAKIEFGTRSQIITNGRQNYNANTRTNLVNKIQTTAVGAIAGQDARSIIRATINDEISGNSSSFISNGPLEKSSITFSSKDNTKVTSLASATIPGGAGVITTISDNKVTRNNKVTLDNSQIKSGGDLEILAGKDSSLTMDLSANAYNQTAIPLVTDPSVNLSINENNIVSLALSGRNVAARDIYLYAKGGNTSIKKITETFRWIDGGKSGSRSYLGNKEGRAVFDGLQSNNKISLAFDVNGSLLAGNANKVVITISGTKVPDGYSVVRGPQAKGYAAKVTRLSADIAEDESDTNKYVVFATENYHTTLYNQYQNILKLIQEYSMDDSERNTKGYAAYQGYLNEKNRILEEMNQRGFAVGETVIDPKEGTLNDGTNIAAPEVWINTATVQDLSVSGGNAYIETDDTTDVKKQIENKKLRADGSPYIQVNNNSNAYLRIKSLTIGGEGGLVYVNGEKAQAATTGSAAKIEVNHDFTKTTYQIHDNKSGENTQYTAVSTMEIIGNIDNPLGSVSLKSNGDLLISGVSVTGQSINLSAVGTLSQSYFDGLFSAGATPSYQYQIYAKALKDKNIDLEEFAKAAQNAADKKPVERNFSSAQDTSDMTLLNLEKSGIKSFVTLHQQQEVDSVKNNIDELFAPFFFDMDAWRTREQEARKTGIFTGLLPRGLIMYKGSEDEFINNYASVYSKKFTQIFGQKNIPLNVAKELRELLIKWKGKMQGNESADKFIVGKVKILTPENVFDLMKNSKNSEANRLFLQWLLKSGKSNSLLAITHIPSASSISLLETKLSAENTDKLGKTGIATALVTKSNNFISGIKTFITDLANANLAGGAKEYNDVIQTIVNRNNAINNAINQQYASLMKNAREANQRYGQWTSAQWADDSDVVSAAFKAAGVSGSTIAGGNVYISAAYLNLNGLVQSGFDKYSVSVNANSLKNLVDFDETRQAYKINNGNQSKMIGSGNDRKFVYEVQAYYDKVNDKIIVDDIDVSGGKMYISGQILSTGGGKLRVASGGADVSIVNDTGKALELGAIRNNMREGWLEITDDNRTDLENVSTTKTVYRKDELGKLQSKVIKDYKGQDTGTWSDILEKGLAYTPSTPNIRYYWTEGNATLNTVTKQKSYKTYIGFIKTRADIKKIIDDTSVAADNIMSGEEQTSDLSKGVFVKSVTPEEAKALGNKLNLDATSMQVKVYERDENGNVVMENGKPKEQPLVTNWESWTKSKWLGIVKTTYVRWTEEQGSRQTYLYSVPADKAIGIEFIGQKDGKIEITSNNNRSVKLMGDVINNAGNNKFIINAQNALVEQAKGTSINANHLQVNANKGIKNLNITAAAIAQSKDSKGVIQRKDDVVLNLNSAGGDIDVNVNKAFRRGDTATYHGNVLVEQLKAKGNITLTADGSINQKNDNPIEAMRINLVSRNEGIGTQDKPLLIKAGQVASIANNPQSASVNASSEKDIFLKQTVGDMRIGSIVSTTGNVRLEAPGRFVDALAGVVVNSSETVTDKIHRWVDAGLIAGDESYQGAYKTQLLAEFESYEKGLEETIKEYVKQHSSYVPESVTENIVRALAQKSEAEWKADESVAKMEFSKDSWKDAKNKLSTALESSDPVAKLIEYAKQGAEYQYLKHYSENPKYVWSKELLLNAIKDVAYNDKESTGTTDVQDRKQANIVAHNVSLKGAGIGLLDKEEKLISVDDLSEGAKDRFANMALLAASEISDIIENKNENNEVISYRILNRRPLGIYVKPQNGVEGQFNFERASVEKADAYIAARAQQEGTKSASLGLGNIDAGKGDIRILGKDGVTNELVSDKAINLIGANLIIEAGNGDIGTVQKSVTLAIQNLVEGVRAKNAYIKNLTENPLTFRSASVGDDDIVVGGTVVGEFVIHSASGIMSEQLNGDVKGHVRADKLLTLITDNNVGTQNNKLRVLANGNVVNVVGTDDKHTPGDIYIEGISKDGDSSLVLGDISANTLTVKSQAGLQAGTTEDDEGEETVSKIKATKVTLEADKSIVLAADIQTPSLSLKSTRDGITEQEKAIVRANTVDIFSRKAVDFTDGKNYIDTLHIDGIEEQISEGTEDPARVNKYDIDGSVEVNVLDGVAETGENALLTVSIAKPVVGNINLTHEVGSILLNGDSLTTKSATNENGAIIQGREGHIDINAQKNITSNTGKVDAAGHISLVSQQGNISTNNSINAGTSVVAQTAAGIINLGGNVTGGTSVTAHTGAGDITVGGSVKAEKENVELTVKGEGKISTTGAINAGTSVVAQTAAG